MDADRLQGIHFEIFEITPLGKDVIPDSDSGPGSVFLRNHFKNEML